MKTHLRSAMHRALVATIVEARAAAGLTQRALAAKLKRSDSFVWKQLKVLEFIAVTNALDVEPEELLRRARKNAQR